jgi:hypothetical protein
MVQNQMSTDSINRAAFRANCGLHATTSPEAANPYSPYLCAALLVAAIGLIISLG